MKLALPLILLLCFSIIQAQDGYPIPESTPTRLFYIQHSHNHNTYVYDANMEGKSIDRENPVEEYRILYTKGGIKKPLTKLQKELAYGLDIDFLRHNFFEMHLAASKKLKFYLTLDEHGKPRVYVTVNDKKIFLKRMFIQLKDSATGIHAKVDYVLLEGLDSQMAVSVSEKVSL
ncbi:DUF4833 domain-containing protein [Robertkochia solimangrovi]|uniref:DUF4833 domain-containing protein n=1 Tax=Robertkochia solimangrovi TaxID=2213046 RepID=UPI00117C1BF8|nr:DUF4833 domain-containing protein [Robertkochia solimangrovi]TRZ43202.1 DUF4833 domain-containing protein [Robertkochia solimangrovi]